MLSAKLPGAPVFKGRGWVNLQYSKQHHSFLSSVLWSKTFRGETCFGEERRLFFFILTYAQTMPEQLSTKLSPNCFILNSQNRTKHLHLNFRLDYSLVPGGCPVCMKCALRLSVVLRKYGSKVHHLSCSESPGVQQNSSGDVLSENSGES